MATPTAISSSPGLSGDASPMRNVSGPNLQSILQTGKMISGDLKSLVSLLGTQPGSGTLEQYLSAPSKSHLTTPSTPATPQNPTSWGTNRKRSRTTGDRNTNETPMQLKRRRVSAKQSADKQPGKGLRHFSQRVCEKVREKGTTSYNEVADELVKELSETESTNRGNDAPIDQKNIRRRVYDALNVLMAMNIISKEKKEIRWIGLPTNSAQECQHVEDELSKVEQRVQTKRAQVESLLIQILSFKNLMKRNRERVTSLGAPAQNSSISLPFILVNTSKKTTIDCSISSDKSEYVFSFDNAFELHNDIDVLKKMGLDCGIHSGNFTDEDIKTAKAMLPKAFESALDDIVTNKTAAATQATPISTPETLPNPSPFTPLSITNSPLAREQLISAFGQTLNSDSISPTVKPSSPIIVPCLPGSGLPSPQAVTALVTSVMRGAKIPVKSPGLSAKAAMHSHCPSSAQQVAMSPLIKSSLANAPEHQSNLTQSPISVKSVGDSSPASQQKVVTISRLPPQDQIATLLQQLQQNASLSKLISTATGTTSTASRQLFTGSPAGNNSESKKEIQ